MQCRICFEEGGDLVVPCQCRGTASYIHRTCLEQYIHYYPDRICRVCRTHFNYYDQPREVFLGWFLMVVLTFLLFFSSSKLIVKLILFLATSLLYLYFLRRNLFDITSAFSITVLVILFLPGGHPSAIYIWILILGLLAFVYTLMQFLPGIVVLGIVVGTILAGYTGFLLLLSYHVLDSSAFTVLITVIYMAWYAWLHARLRLV